MGQLLSGTEETDKSRYSDSLDELQSGHDARSPSKKLCSEYHSLIELLRQQLQPDTISRIEYVGSKYKRTDIKGSDLDNLFIKRDFDIEVDRSAGWGEHVMLKTPSGIIFGGSYIDPIKKRQEFKGKVHRALNAIGYSNRARLADHGPAIELRYDYDGVEFEVDLVFCYEVAEGEMYTAKPPKCASGQELMFWKYSTALEEKKRMSTIDKGNMVSRRAVKIVKEAIRKEATLQVLTSYVVEQALYHIRDDVPDVFWVENNMKEIVRKILVKMADAVEEGLLSNFFNPDETNVLPQMSPSTRSNVANRLRRLSKDPNPQKMIDSYISTLKSPNDL